MIALGADHGGYALKEEIKKHLKEIGREFKDFGTFSEESVDYPDYAAKVCGAIVDGTCSEGILCCGTGIGMSIAANKIKGIRAAHLTDCYSAKMSKQHNNANVICLGGRITGVDLAIMIVDEYLNAKFLGERHQRRIDKIDLLDKDRE